MSRKKILKDPVYHQGKFIPRNPEKYIGDLNNIIFRSSWEKRVFKYMDSCDRVLKWSSEEIIIPYVSPVDNKWHRYFVDVFARVKTFDESIKTYLIEIKPLKQTVQPSSKETIDNQYIYEVCTWGVNSAKWEAATDYCKKKGWEFKILTEREILGVDL